VDFEDGAQDLHENLFDLRRFTSSKQSSAERLNLSVKGA
jgi:hypothetical protein